MALVSTYHRREMNAWNLLRVKDGRPLRLTVPRASMSTLSREYASLDAPELHGPPLPVAWITLPSLFLLISLCD